MIGKTVYKMKSNNLCVPQQRSTTEYLNPVKRSAEFKNKLTRGANNYEDLKHAYLKTGETHMPTEHIDCHEPKVPNKQEKSRSFKKFIEDQENYQTIRENKIKEFQTENTKLEASSCTNRPEIDAMSKRICTQMNYCKEEVIERLSKRKVLEEERNVDEIFSPKILARSKSLKRGKDICELLHSDSIRRKEKREFIESNNKLIPLTSPAINNNTNHLVCKKLYIEFCEIIPEQEEVIPLVLVWTALSEIFGAELNPNKSEKERRLCEEICELLCSNGDESVSRAKLWEFIEIIVKKHDAKPIAFINDVEKIVDRFGDLYTCRVSRSRCHREPQEYSFCPETLKSSERKAQKHRNKILETVKTYVENENSKIKLNNEITLEEMFLIDHQMKRSSLEKKKIQKEEEEIKKCTFKPRLSESYARPVFMPPKVSIGISKCVESKRTFNKSMSSQSLSMSQSIFSQSIKPITMNNVENLTPATKIKKSIPNSLLASSEKSVMRMTIGRKNRELSNELKNRGYSEKVENWTIYAQTEKRELEKEHKKLSGLTTKRVSLR